VLAAVKIRISMDGKGRWMDNVFIERLWRSLKYEDLYIKGCADGAEARTGIAEWFSSYNHKRPHQALGNEVPMEVWRKGTTGTLPPGAVDMTLVVRTSLDNAGALTTYPPHQLKQQAA
jgi:putative transposase